MLLLMAIYIKKLTKIFTLFLIGIITITIIIIVKFQFFLIKKTHK